jgi:hypothetical protein
MRVAKHDVDVKMEIPGAVIRQRTNFGDATGLGKISGECFTLSAGVDTTPLFQGLEGNLCHCPHWGFVLRGQLTTTDAEGTLETVKADAEWRRQLLERASDVFGGSGEPAEPAVDLKLLHVKIGKLTLEHDFLEGALTKAGLLSARK